jgi:hypothetical protein
MKSHCEGQHNVYVVPFVGNKASALDETELFILASYLFEAIGMIIKTHQHCATCGSVVPELQIDIGNTALHFTCHKIEKDGKTLVETDYKKFAEYIKKLEGSKDKHVLLS